jgi:hypothetical protein
MTKYDNGKIYKIEPICDHDENEIYIGSTTHKYLSERMTKHRYEYKNRNNNGNQYTCFIIFDKYGIENCEIILIENVKCKTKDELHSREKHFIKTMECVNKCVPLRSKEEYYQDNKNKIKENVKMYYLANEQKFKEKHDCECGGHYTTDSKRQHVKRKKHLQYIELQN